MKKLLCLTNLLLWSIALLTLSPQAAKACTGLLVAKGASVDGSVMISYAADSHTLYGELYRYPAANWPKGTMRQIVEWDTGKPLGAIPEVAHTYSVIGNINEHQVAITESTWGGRKELENPEGLLDYGSLMWIGLQRSKTAREAIKVITDLVAEYGYHSSGESFSIADKNEVWILEMIGKGPGKKGAVWVAMRIPDNAIAAHANQSRIQQIKFNDPDNCLYSKDVIDFAREKGYFKGEDKDFSFQKAYNPWTMGGLRGCEARVWAFFNKFVDGMDKYLALAMGDTKQAPMPLYFVPKKKISVKDIRDMMRDHYEGTPMDMTKDVGAGAYKVPYRWRPMEYEVDGQTYLNERAIATQQTGFVLVAQLRNNLPDAIGGILWFGVDDANTAVFTPMYCSMTEVPHCYEHGNGDMLHFSWESAFWIHNWVANMAYSRYNLMIDDIRALQSDLENSFDRSTKEFEANYLKMAKNKKNAAKLQEMVNKFSVNIANETTAKWKKLGEFLLVKYMDGNRKKMKDGEFMTNGYGLPAMPDFPGYDECYYRHIAETSGEHLKVKE